MIGFTVRRLFCTEAPRWMRFFGKFDPMIVNIERSLKNESNESLNIYVKSNYRSFTSNQLVKAIDKFLSNDVNKCMIYDLIDRMKVGQEDCLLEVLSLKDRKWMPDILTQQLILKGIVNQHQFDHNQKVEYMGLMLSQGLAHPIMEEYLQEIDPNQLSLGQFKYIFQLIDHIANPDLDLIEQLVNRYNYILNSEDLLITQKDVDIYSHLIYQMPAVFTPEQKQLIKQSYANIFQKAYDKDYQTVYPKPLYNRQVLQTIINIYEPQDYNMIRRTLQLFCDSNQNDLRHDYQIFQTFDKFNLYNHQYCQSLIQHVMEYNFNVFLAANYQKQIEEFESFHIIRAYAFMRFNIQNADFKQHVQSLFQKYFVQVNPMDDAEQAREMLIKQQSYEYMPEFDSKYMEEFYFHYQTVESRTQNQGDVKSTAQENRRKAQENLKECIAYSKQLQAELANNKFFYLSQRQVDYKIKSIRAMISYIETVFVASLYEVKNMNKSFFQSETLELLIEKIPYLPHLLENLLMILKLNPDLMSLKIRQSLLRLKQEIDELAHGEPQVFIDKVEEEISKYDTTRVAFDLYKMHRKSNLQNLNFNDKEIHHHSFFKNPIPEHSFKEQFNYTRRNLLLKLMHQGETLLNITRLKTCIWNVLKQDQEWQLNYSDYPLCIDFINKKQKIILLLDQYPRLIKGQYKSYNLETTLIHRLYSDHQIVHLDESIYHANPDELLNILKSKYVYHQ